MTEGYVRACEGDPADWEPRWKEAEAATTGAVARKKRTRHRRAWVSPASNLQTGTTTMSLSPSGDRLLTVSPADVRVWNTRTGRQVAELPDSGVRHASMSADGTFLTTGDDSEAQVWRLSAPDAPVFRRDLNHQRPYGGLGWDPSRPVLRYLEGGTVHSLDLGPAVTSA
ncbi:hypothetical protein ACFY8N_20755 [Streptomyces collinus]|uniref:hypothetical protein n=1 Tax=Streptomyces collinus TaxID=42684 RepID=UPI0036BA9F67